MNSNSNNRLWNKLQKPRYRDALIAANVGAQIATQLHALRTSRGVSQEKLADEIGMNQSTISQMEKPEYRTYSISTLIRFAQHYKVALDVRFVSLVDHLKRLANQTSESLAPQPFGEPLVAPREPEVPRAQVTAPDQDKQPSFENLKLTRKSPRSKAAQDDKHLFELVEDLRLADERPNAGA
jgi:transcriptional regulator with XRE-family HTH domain